MVVAVVVVAVPATGVATAAAMAIHLDPAANPRGGKDSAPIPGSSCLTGPLGIGEREFHQHNPAYPTSSISLLLLARARHSPAFQFSSSHLFPLATLSVSSRAPNPG